MSNIVYTLTTLADTVGHWKFRDTLLDSSKYDNHLIGVNIDSSDFSSGYTESGNTSVDMTGANTVYIAEVDATDFDMGMSDFTIEVIFNSSNQSMFCRKSTESYTISNDGTGGYFIGLRDDTFQVGIGDGTNNVDYIATSLDLTQDTWYYCAVVVDRVNDIMTCYASGSALAAPVDISSVTGNISDVAVPFLIGQHTANNVIDEVCITKRGLTAAEIAVRATGHGDPQVFGYSGSADIIYNTVTTTLNTFDINLTHSCNHNLATGQYSLLKCPRCLGTGYYKDIRFDTDGRPTMLSIEDKLAQSLEKILLTSSNKFHQDLTVNIKDRTGELIEDIENIIKYDLIEAVASLQENQRGITNLSPRAQIARLDAVDVFKNGVTSLRYLIEITTVSGEHVEVSGVFNLRE